MGKGRFIAAALAATAAVATPLAAQGVNPFAMRLLEAHNEARADVGVPELRWSYRLAQDAQDWAEHLARREQLVHGSIDERKGQGENLWMGQAGYFSAEDMIGGFVGERRHFRNGEFPAVSRTGQWRDVGHYTQIVWRGTQEVGCAVARGRTNDVLVCRYWPAGNTYGQRVY